MNKIIITYIKYGCFIVRLPPLDPSSTLSIVKDYTRYPLTSVAKKVELYGEIYRQNLFSKPHYLVANADGIQHVLLDNAGNYPKSSFGYDDLSKEFGENILTTIREDFWKKSRSSATPIFLNSRFDDYAKQVNQNVLHVIAGWENKIKNNEPIDMQAEFLTITMSNLLTTIFKDINIDFDAFAKASWNYTQEAGEKIGTINRLPWLLPTKRRKRYQTFKKAYDGIIRKIVQQRLASKKQPADVLANYITEFKGDQKVLENQLHMFLLAGHETAAATLSWTLIYISTFPQIAATMRQELDSVLQGRLPTYADLPTLTYTNCVLKEVLRLRSPGVMSLREAKKDDVICGFDVEKGTIIHIPIYYMHRNPHYWTNPEGFEPERFVNSPSGQSHKFAYIPFMAGQRACIGSSFALLELCITMAILLPKYNFSLLPTYIATPKNYITVWPKEGLKMHVSQR